MMGDRKNMKHVGESQSDPMIPHSRARMCGGARRVTGRRCAHSCRKVTSVSRRLQRRVMLPTL
eukprot:COSAG01_NODE_860_length_13064_cov_23.466949_14_plen_63_part_00